MEAPDQPLITVGQLARRAGMRPSALRFYEEQGLLPPTAHSPAGYRLYDEQAEQTLAFILRAQRLGFALADIRELLGARASGGDVDATLLALAEARYLAIERQLTPLLVARHELTHLLQDVRSAAGARPRLDRLIQQICVDPLRQPAENSLARLLDLTDCRLSSAEGRALLANLRGRHAHIWQEGPAYHMLLVGDDPAAGAALERLASLEQSCHTHAQAALSAEMRRTDEGFLLSVRGDDAFLYARLFLALEPDETP